MLHKMGLIYDAFIQCFYVGFGSMFEAIAECMNWLLLSVLKCLWWVVTLPFRIVWFIFRTVWEALTKPMSLGAVAGLVFCSLIFFVHPHFGIVSLILLFLVVTKIEQSIDKRTPPKE
jgi:hypothetical protein